MPYFETFKNAESYYASLAHEVTHWTRHPSRLDRSFGRKRSGDEGYAMEELVAELGAAFLCVDLDLDLDLEPAPRADPADYIGHWLQVLKNDGPTRSAPPIFFPTSIPPAGRRPRSGGFFPFHQHCNNEGNIPMHTTSKLIEVPFNKLVLWDGNVCTTGIASGLDELTASIAAHGMLNPLLLRNVAEDPSSQSSSGPRFCR
jgi:hypothetical protein